MSVPAYPEYKDSGVGWMGAVPAHWPIVHSRRYFALRKDRADEGDQQLTASQKWGVIYQSDFMEREGQKVVQVILNIEILKKVHPNDFVISMRSFQGGIEWCGLNGSISSAYVMLIPNERVEPAFFKYLFKSKGYIQALQSTSNLIRDGQALRYENFVQVELPLPAQTEQMAIAVFLDRETAKIDGLVAEQERLIALLKEKRQAVISHAVTKGLNPNAPLKDSGIEWLGQIPAHWEMKRLKDICAEIVDCKNRTPEPSEDGEYLVVRTTCVRDGTFDAGGGYYTDLASYTEWTKKGLPREGDVLFTREAPAGEACIAPKGIDFCLGQRMMFLRPNPDQCIPEYLLYNNYGPLVREIILSTARGSTVAHLRVGEIGELRCILPSLSEQKEIASFIGRIICDFELLTAAAQNAVTLMQERRAALISAAVTGKIDVRAAVALAPELEIA